ncbi:hypothetical protein V8F06_009693 [Rhypophila decipiens]
MYLYIGLREIVQYDVYQTPYFCFLCGLFAPILVSDWVSRLVAMVCLMVIMSSTAMTSAFDDGVAKKKEENWSGMNVAQGLTAIQSIPLNSWFIFRTKGERSAYAYSMAFKCVDT